MHPFLDASIDASIEASILKNFYFCTVKKKSEKLLRNFSLFFLTHPSFIPHYFLNLFKKSFTFCKLQYNQYFFEFKTIS